MSRKSQKATKPMPGIPDKLKRKEVQLYRQERLANWLSQIEWPQKSTTKSEIETSPQAQFETLDTIPQSLWRIYNLNPQIDLSQLVLDKVVIPGIVNWVLENYMYPNTSRAKS